MNISKFVHPLINSSLLNIYDAKHLLFKCSFYPAEVYVYLSNTIMGGLKWE